MKFNQIEFAINLICNENKKLIKFKNNFSENKHKIYQEVIDFNKNCYILFKLILGFQIKNHSYFILKLFWFQSSIHFLD
jgi:hypothetical protein